MGKVFLIRHAESKSNVGGVFEHQNIITITDEGKKQAEKLSEILGRPDRIICSRYIRTIETAEPLIKRFPESEIHLWTDTHEFQPLDSKRHIGILKEQNEDLHRLYWRRLDPLYNDGGNAESFKNFVERVSSSILKMRHLRGVNYIFTHRNFIRCALTLLSNFDKYETTTKSPDLYLKIMMRFVETYHSGKLEIKNAEVFDLTDLLSNYSKD